MIALLRIRQLAKELHWTARETLETHRLLVRDLLTASRYEAQLR